MNMLPSNRISAHPGEILLHEFLLPSATTQAALARAIGIPQNRVNEIVKGKRGITAETALLFSAYFHNSAEFWMNLQVAYDLSKARASRKKMSVTVSKRKRGAVA
jgi:addiction module HigA family antidote